MSNSISFNMIRNLVILGGGELATKVIAEFHPLFKSVLLVTSPRYFGPDRHFQLPFKTTTRPSHNYDVPTLVLDHLDYEADLKSFLPDNFNDTLFLSLGAPWIFKEETLASTFQGKVINLHGTRLPHDRGGAWISWTIMRGNRLGALTLHLISKGIDDGPILLQEEFVYSYQNRIPLDFQTEFDRNALVFLGRFFVKITNENAEFDLRAQSLIHATYNPRLDTSLSSWINWNWEVSEIEKFICAFDDPYSGAQTFLSQNKFVKIKSVIATYEYCSQHPFENGLIFQKGIDYILVKCRNGSLIIRMVMDEQSHNLIQKISVGDRFTTPGQKLDLSLERVKIVP